MCNLARHKPDARPDARRRLVCAVVFALEIALYESRDATQRFTLLVDLRGFERKNFDQFFIAKAFTTIFKHYPNRMHRCLLWDAPLVFNAAWAIVRTWIPESLSSKFVFVKGQPDEGDHSVLTDYVDASALPRGPSADRLAKLSHALRRPRPPRPRRVELADGAARARGRHRAAAAAARRRRRAAAPAERPAARHRLAAGAPARPPPPRRSPRLPRRRRRRQPRRGGGEIAARDTRRRRTRPGPAAGGSD